MGSTVLISASQMLLSECPIGPETFNLKRSKCLKQEQYLSAAARSNEIGLWSDLRPTLSGTVRAVMHFSLFPPFCTSCPAFTFPLEQISVTGGLQDFDPVLTPLGRNQQVSHQPKLQVEEWEEFKFLMEYRGKKIGTRRGTNKKRGQ